MRQSKKLFLGIMIIVSTAFLCGYGTNYMKVDPDKTVIYDVISAYDYNADSARYLSFDGHDVMMSGTVTAKDTSNKSFYLSDGNDSRVVYVDSSDVKKETAAIRDGMEVRVFGNIQIENGRPPELTAEKIELVKGNEKSGDYIFYDGTLYNDSDMTEVSIGDGAVTYRIPKIWSYVEQEEALVSPDIGHYYDINKVKHKSSSECFCILYFKYDKYVKYENERDEQNGIERAIITNITGKDLGIFSIDHYTFWTKTFEPSYGRSFDYYITDYNDHVVEFLFTPAKDGLVVMMYIYDDDYSSNKDILYIMRTLKA